MDILLKGVTIIDLSSPFHQQTTDIFIQNGYVAEIGKIDRQADRHISHAGLHISPGFTDIFSHFCDPGLEYRETLETGASAAAYGGYTDVLILPNTIPVNHYKAGINYVTQKSHALPVTVHPIGAISKNAEGKELAEMYDMHQSGAVAFSDGLCAVQSAGLLVKALQYVKAINKTVIQLPDDASITAHGLMNEGIVSTRLGLPGKPAIAEELMITRDIELAKYTQAKLHITGVSTSKGIEIIKKAKEEGVAITCSVTPYHLLFTDEDLEAYDTNLKLCPPLRTKNDRTSLQAAVLSGIVDCIATHHLPQHTDNKVVEFEYAKNGMIGLETGFAVLRTAMPDLPLEQLVNLLSLNPRKLFDLPAVTIDTNLRATFSLYFPNEPWTPETFVSRSKNSPFIGKQLTGKPLGIIHKEKLFLRP